MEVSSPLMDSFDEQVENLTCPSSTVHHRPPSPKSEIPVFLLPSTEKRPSANSISVSSTPMEPLHESKQTFSRSMSVDSGAGKLDIIENPAQSLLHKLPSATTFAESLSAYSVVNATMPLTNRGSAFTAVSGGTMTSSFGSDVTRPRSGLYNAQLSPTSTTVTPQSGFRRMSEDSSYSNDITDTQENSMIDSSNPKSVFVPCKVCGDRASGFHYGVTSCEGCKGFFRRSIQKQIEYRCLRDGKCMVIRLNRNRCQFCRFKKCMAVGMSRESVRYGRVPRNNKKEQQQPNSTTDPEEPPLSPMLSTPTTTTATPPPTSIADTPRTPPIDQSNHDIPLADQSNRSNSPTTPALDQSHQSSKQENVSQMSLSATPSDGGVTERRYLMYEMMVKVSQAFHTHCALTSEKWPNIQQKHISLLGVRDVKLDKSEMEKWEEHRCTMFDSLARFINPQVQKIVEFAKRVPGFLALSQDSQLVLIKQGFLELWLLYMCRAFDANNNIVTFPDGSTVSRQELDVVFTRENVDDMFRLLPRFVSNASLNDTEIALLSAYVLTEPARRGLISHQPVTQLHQTLHDVMELQISQNHRDNPTLLATLLIDYADLNSLGTKLLDIFAWFRTRWHHMSLPPLFSEIFDIPKREEKVS